MLNTFTEKLSKHCDLTARELDSVRAVNIQPLAIGAGHNLAREGDRPLRCILVLAGLASTSKLNREGNRQTAAFHMAGDMPDLMTLHLDVLDSDIRTLSDCTVAFIDHSVIRALCDKHPRLAATLWRSTLVDASVYREWVVNVGSRPALNAMAHLLCEVMRRMEAIGLADGSVCEFGLSQTDLSEATGVSLVHVNRVLQRLRKMDLISFVHGRLTIHDWVGLSTLADFQDDYLHLGDKLAHSR